MTRPTGGPLPGQPVDGPKPPPDTSWVQGWAEADDFHPAEAMKERVSTLLSTVAILCIAVGIGWGLWPLVGPWALCGGGVVLAVLVAFADAARKPSQAARGASADTMTAPAGPPGPTSPGNLHTKGPGAES